VKGCQSHDICVFVKRCVTSSWAKGCNFCSFFHGFMCVSRVDELLVCYHHHNTCFNEKGDDVKEISCHANFAQVFIEFHCATRSLVMAPAHNETYVKLVLIRNDENPSARNYQPQTLFVKGTWYSTHFLLSALDGCNIWTLDGTFSIIILMTILLFFSCYPFLLVQVATNKQR